MITCAQSIFSKPKFSSISGYKCKLDTIRVILPGLMLGVAELKLGTFLYQKKLYPRYPLRLTGSIGKALLKLDHKLPLKEKSNKYMPQRGDPYNSQSLQRPLPLFLCIDMKIPNMVTQFLTKFCIEQIHFLYWSIQYSDHTLIIELFFISDREDKHLQIVCDKVWQ